MQCTQQTSRGPYLRRTATSIPSKCAMMVGLHTTFESVALLSVSEPTPAARLGEHARAGVKRRRVLPCPTNEDEDEELLALLQGSQVQPSSPGRATTGDVAGPSRATVPVSADRAGSDPTQCSNEQLERPIADVPGAELAPDSTGGDAGKHSTCKTTAHRGSCSRRSLTLHNVARPCLDSAGAQTALLSDNALLRRNSSSSSSSSRRSPGPLQERSRRGWALHQRHRGGRRARVLQHAGLCQRPGAEPAHSVSWGPAHKRLHAHSHGAGQHHIICSVPACQCCSVPLATRLIP